MRRHVGCVCRWEGGWGGLVGGKHVCRSGRAHISCPAVSSPSQRWKVSGAPSGGSVSLPLYTSVPSLFQQQHHNTLWQLSSWRINMDSPPPTTTPTPHRTPPPMLLCSLFKHWSDRRSGHERLSLGLVLNMLPFTPATPRSPAERRRRLATVPSASVILMFHFFRERLWKQR